MIEHVLLDADGVLQRSPRDPVGVLARWVGDDAETLLRELWTAEGPTLEGVRDFPDVADAIAHRWGIDPPADLYAALWSDIEVAPSTPGFVADLRDLGLGVHLGTNQHLTRGRRMREALGYDDLFDVSCYSGELGVRKPDPAFFRRAVELIGGPADRVLFVDDVPANVDGARSVGLAAERWHLDDGWPALQKSLAAHGVLLPD